MPASICFEGIKNPINCIPIHSCAHIDAGGALLLCECGRDRNESVLQRAAVVQERDVYIESRERSLGSRTRFPSPIYIHTHPELPRTTAIVPLFTRSTRASTYSSSLTHTLYLHRSFAHLHVIRPSVRELARRRVDRSGF